MKQDAATFLRWALGVNFLTHRESNLYYEYIRMNGKHDTPDSKDRFQTVLRRLSKMGLAVLIFDRCWAFPDADIFVKMRDHPEAPDVIIQDALYDISVVGNKGGFDVLYNEACITVPPKRKVIFASGDEFFDIRTDLRRMSGANIRLDAFVVPRERGGVGSGIMKTKIEGFPFRRSSIERATEEAWWLVESEWGKITGLSGQRCLLEAMEQEKLDDEAGISY